jgi:hypothetical protein
MTNTFSPAPRFFCATSMTRTPNAPAPRVRRVLTFDVLDPTPREMLGGLLLALALVLPAALVVGLLFLLGAF